MIEPNPHLNARLTAETLETYFKAGVVVPVSVADEPSCTLRIDPLKDTLELWTPADGPEPDVGSLSRVQVDTEELDKGPMFVLTVDARGAHLEAYSLLAAIVDDLVEGRTFQSAVLRSITSFRDLLAGRGRLSEERTLGLIGELLVLEHLIPTMGEDAAVTAWTGPESEEHDFVLPSLDAEVKTTLSERRTHVINSETQLQTSAARPLWLVSLQLTRAGTATDGYTLPEVIGRVRAQLANSASTFNAHLGGQGWRDADADLYGERYMPRTPPQAYLIDDTFPAITRGRLDSVVPQPELVGPVTYRVDISGLVPQVPEGPLHDFVGGESE